jgi:hypothetical protein
MILSISSSVHVRLVVSPLGPGLAGGGPCAGIAMTDVRRNAGTSIRIVRFVMISD